MSTEKITERKVFSERLKTLRDTRRKSEFSRFLGIPPPVYQRYEEGRIPNAENLSVIAQRCGVTVDWLLGRERTDTGKAGGVPAASPSIVREDPCHYPGTLPSEVAAIRERLSAMEADMHTMAAQMQTITGLLSGALRNGIETRKAG